MISSKPKIYDKLSNICFLFAGNVFLGKQIKVPGVGLMLSIIATYFWWTVVSYIVVRLLKCSFILVKSIIVHFITPIYNLDHLRDAWTVVTGGTDGIGRAYIEELARTRGLKKFYLIGRNRQKLDRVVKELCERYDAECKTTVFDFEYDSYEKLPQELSDMDIGILINCAGISSNQVGDFMELPKGTASKILRVNLMSSIKIQHVCTSVLLLSQSNGFFYPYSLKTLLCSFYNHSILVFCVPGRENIRNLAFYVDYLTSLNTFQGWRPLPYISTYPASKAAISFYSDCLSDEFRHTNVRIQCLIPMLVATKVASYEISEANNLFVVTPENYAKQAVRAIGRFEIITGCVQHDVQLREMTPRCFGWEKQVILFGRSGISNRDMRSCKNIGMIALGTLISFWVFKQIYVPIVMLGIHKERVAAYQRSHRKDA
ncbi:hypothetical protein NECAME_10170 [Necator americanus]|uniref:Oxidoreductase, short chain dehydrogenase/reductase family protein n=1 Tax=Necator americanus TaxID=51031 RepID=W2TC68_NECAM|nr:hypothetical protein NECAME_10170 [Necator americanus]ETN78756.1 hypothetical protein NECAME_10170 [Necator americanus]